MTTGTQQVRDFADLVGTNVATAWAQTGKDLDAFADIAGRWLEVGLATHPLRAVDVVEWLVHPGALAPQPAWDGQSATPVTIFCNGELQIDVLFWMESLATSVHDHPSTGAFAGISGTSLEVQYSFDKDPSFGPGFLVGKLGVEAVTVLDPGTIRTFPPADGLVHSLIHLDGPRVTAVVSTCDDPSTDVHLYLPPHVAVGVTQPDGLRERRLRLVRMLVRSQSPELAPTIRALIDTCDARTAFLAIREIAYDRRGFSQLPAALERCDQRWPGVADRVAESLAAELRHQRSLDLLRAEEDTERKLLLSALAAVDERRWVDRAMQVMRPGIDVDQLVRRCVDRWLATDVVAADDTGFLEPLMPPSADGREVVPAAPRKA